jgi:nucleoside-diphosphate-sugar epimerase
MNILILGGTGFIGEYLAKALAQDKVNHIVVAHVSELKDQYRLPEVEYLRIDLTQPNASLGSALKNANTIVFAIQPDHAFVENVLAQIENTSQKKKLIYLSTLLVYPDSEFAHKEGAPLDPKTAYETAKVEEERLMIHFAKDSEISLCIARLGNVYGDVKNKGVVNHLLRAVIEDRPFQLNGDGVQTRDYIHVEDVAAALSTLISLEQKDIVEIYNVCSGKGYRIMDLIEMIEGIAKTPLKRTSGPSIEEKYTVLGDPGKLRRLLPTLGLDGMLPSLKKTYQTYLSHYKNNCMQQQFKDKIILVTGGTGSIGSEIVFQLLESGAAQVRVFSRDETKQFDLAHRLGGNPRLRFLIGDVRDRERLNMAMEGADIVFHAAALKHVVSCELNPFEAVKTNVGGTQNLIECAFKNNIEKVISVSTDKAADPTNVMGCTKLLAERLVLSSYFYKGKKRTKFCSVRFGNVLGSRGSVIPLFINQIKNGGPLTVTDPSMTRFFMSIKQAVGLMFHAASLMKGQEIFILKMPVATIGDLAKATAAIMKEKSPKLKDVETKIIGKRVGERQHEKLLTLDESETALERDDMYIIRPNVDFEIFHDFSPEMYEGSHPADVRAYSSKHEENMSLDEVKAMILSIPELDFSA